MRLETFQVTDYRSINNSNRVDVSQITAILGRNESGKSNLLRALHSLNPLGGIEPLSKVKDFPRHRKLSECTDSTWMLETSWSLTEDERSELLDIFPRLTPTTIVKVWRRYDEHRYVGFENLDPLDFDKSAVNVKIRKITAAVAALAEGQVEPKGSSLTAASTAFSNSAQAKTGDAEKWSSAAKPQVATLRKALAAAQLDLPDQHDAVLVEIEEQIEALDEDVSNLASAKKWVLTNLPTSIYVDEYPDFEGHQDISAYLQRKSRSQLTEADRNFEKLCKVAGLNPTELQNLASQSDHETRSQLVNRAGAVVTAAIRRLWKDRSLKVRFNLDSQHLDTLISDPNALYDVEVNLDDRSRGFKWFFSFYLTFAADTQGGNAEEAILLLDEPGLYLHARSQADLLTHFEKDFSNQILYTTHSPFMVPTNNLDRIRTVNISEEQGTQVTNDPTGDARTLFPLQAALGYDLSQNLFVGPRNLIVEGVTDYWYLSAFSGYLRELGSDSLENSVTITPAGGAQKVSYMVALLTAEKLSVVVLLDQEKEALATQKSLVKAKLLKEERVFFISEAFASPPAEADIEDLLESDVYDGLVRESYKEELVGKSLVLNPNVPRIAVRYELALRDLGVVFHKTRPARLFLKQAGQAPGEVMKGESLKNFERVCQIVNRRLNRS